VAQRYGMRVYIPYRMCGFCIDNNRINYGLFHGSNAWEFERKFLENYVQPSRLCYFLDTPVVQYCKEHKVSENKEYSLLGYSAFGKLISFNPQVNVCGYSHGQTEIISITGT
jgi:hypothetical protein